MTISSLGIIMIKLPPKSDSCINKKVKMNIFSRIAGKNLKSHKFIHIQFAKHIIFYEIKTPLNSLTNSTFLGISTGEQGLY
jgi:hypothetical protein